MLILISQTHAEVAEQADAHDSKSCGRKPMRVRFPPSAPDAVAGFQKGLWMIPSANPLFYDDALLARIPAAGAGYHRSLAKFILRVSMERSSALNKTTIGMALVALVFVAIAFFQGGLPLVAKGFVAGGTTLYTVIPLLIVAFIVAGLVSTLISKEMVTKWLGAEAGWKGPFFGTLMGALVPGGPFFFYPLMATLIVSGANIGTMISFVAAKTLWYVGRIPVEIAFVGLRITAIRFLITFAIPILAGGAVNIFLPRYAEKIKMDVEQRQARNKARSGGIRN